MKKIFNILVLLFFVGLLRINLADAQIAQSDFAFDIEIYGTIAPSGDAKICIVIENLSSELSPSDLEVTMKFDSLFDLSTLTVSDTEALSEVSIFLDESNLVTTSTVGCNTTGRKVEFTETVGNDRDYATINLSNNTVYIKTEDAGTGDSFAVLFEGVSSTNGVTAPSSAGNYQVLTRINWDPLDNDNFLAHSANLVPVGNANQTEIYATVDPTISFYLDKNTCALSLLNSSNVTGCAVVLTVSTNAVSGYSAYVKDANNGTLNSATNNIDAIASSPINAGTEAYGVSTSDSGTAITTTTNCNTTPSVNTSAATALSTISQAFASATNPVNAEATTLCISSSISSITSAGAYSDTLTITVVGSY